MLKTDESLINAREVFHRLKVWIALRLRPICLLKIWNTEIRSSRIHLLFWEKSWQWVGHSSLDKGLRSFTNLITSFWGHSQYISHSIKWTGMDAMPKIRTNDRTIRGCKCMRWQLWEGSSYELIVISKPYNYLSNYLLEWFHFLSIVKHTFIGVAGMLCRVWSMHILIVLKVW